MNTAAWALHSIHKKKKKKNKRRKRIEEGGGGRERESARGSDTRGERWEKEYVGAKRDHLRAKKPSGDLWTLRTDRRAEWADAQR